MPDLPLRGVRVVELAGVGPGPFGVMMLADMGADVIRIDRLAAANADYIPNPVLERGRRSIALDLKSAEGLGVLLDLVAEADVLVECYRPGVAERLGFGPDACFERNSRLVYGRLSGWGQHGPMSDAVGHDINYIGLTGALWAMGRAGEPPAPPLNLVGDFGGGGSQLAIGLLAALVDARVSGRGRVIDANVYDATGTLMALVHGIRGQGRWNHERAANLLDGGCPYYDTYACADGRWMAIGAIEEKFFRTAIDVLGVDQALLAAHKDRGLWPQLREALAAAFATRTRDEWAATFEGVEACVTPVLDLDEAAAHPHAVARGAYVERDGVRHPAVAPRFGHEAPDLTPAPRPRGADTADILRELGHAPDRVERMAASKAVGLG